MMLSLPRNSKLSCGVSRSLGESFAAGLTVASFLGAAIGDGPSFVAAPGADGCDLLDALGVEKVCEASGDSRSASWRPASVPLTLRVSKLRSGSFLVNPCWFDSSYSS